MLINAWTNVHIKVPPHKYISIKNTVEIVHMNDFSCKRIIKMALHYGAAVYNRPTFNESPDKSTSNK